MLTVTVPLLLVVVVACVADAGLGALAKALPAKPVSRAATTTAEPLSQLRSRRRLPVRSIIGPPQLVGGRELSPPCPISPLTNRPKPRTVAGAPRWARSGLGEDGAAEHDGARQEREGERLPPPERGRSRRSLRRPARRNRETDARAGEPEAGAGEGRRPRPERGCPHDRRPPEPGDEDGERPDAEPGAVERGDRGRREETRPLAGHLAAHRERRWS